jgi:RNA polymerase sigma-70 factor (ECF subfamily)
MSNSSQADFARHFVQGQDQVYGFIVVLLANRDAADEVFQQTCLILWEKWDQYDTTRPFLPWACGIARNVARNYVRKERRQAIALSEELIEKLAEDQLAASSQTERRLDALSGCLDQLDLEQRRLLEECYQSSTKIKDVAARLGQSTAAVYKRLDRLRAGLLKCIQQSLDPESHS